MTDSPIQVIDDFLPVDLFKAIAEPLMMGPNYVVMPCTAKLTEDDGSIGTYGEDDDLAKSQKMHEYMMQQILVSKYSTMQQVSDLWMMLSEEFRTLQIKLDIKTLWMARVNVTTGQSENFVGSFHSDNHKHHKRNYMQVAIYYLNTNNGGTKFEDGTFVKSKANRIVIFPRHIEHAGVWCTDRKLRFVMNLNYEKN